MAKTRNSEAENLKKAHANLLDDLGQLEQAVGPTSREKLPELRKRLAATQADVTEHFRYEEQNGYMVTVRKKEPRLERQVQLLVEEHRRLAETLNGLVKDAGTDEEAFRQKVRAWIESIRQHEAHETEVVQDAFNLDIGAED
jgi:hypothetical protein